jgi:hypothetical protein
MSTLDSIIKIVKLSLFQSSCLAEQQFDFANRASFDQGRGISYPYQHCVSTPEGFIFSARWKKIQLLEEGSLTMLRAREQSIHITQTPVNT